jgi:hypothetical protein
MRILAALLSLLFWLPVFGANHYVRSGAGGAANGNNWTDAWTALPTTLTRGDTYFISDGTYSGSYTFDDATSGSTLITIQKATVSSHGIDTGWDDSYGDGQATWTGNWWFRSAYWSIDGVTGGGPGAWSTGLGFKIPRLLNANQDDNADNVTIEHVEIDVGQVGPADARAVELRYNNGWTFRYCYIHDVGSDIFSLVAGVSDFVLEYSMLARNHQNATYHGDVIEIQYGSHSNLTVRWCYLEDVVGSYLFGSHDSATVSGYYIYGNILNFKNVGSGTGNGTLGRLSAGSPPLSTVRFYNNTISGIYSASTLGLYANLGTDIICRNNLWHEGTEGSYSFSWQDSTHDHNTHYNMPTQSGEENLTGNPFTASASDDFSLVANTTAGEDLGSPYNVDMMGTTRSTWTRGAIEYTSGSVAPTITSSAPTAGSVGTAYTYTLNATGTAPITFSVTSGALPNGLSLSSAGVISGTPTAAGTYTGVITASNGTAPDATQSFSITISHTGRMTVTSATAGSMGTP